MQTQDPRSIELKSLIRGFITDQTGLYFKDHDLKGLDEALAKRRTALGIDSLSAYFTYLTSGDSKESELRELLNILTINHTYFFRNEAQFKALKEKVLPEFCLQEEKRGLVRPETRITDLERGMLFRRGSVFDRHRYPRGDPGPGELGYPDIGHRRLE